MNQGKSAQGRGNGCLALLLVSKWINFIHVMDRRLPSIVQQLGPNVDGLENGVAVRPPVFAFLHVGKAVVRDDVVVDAI